ncbi:hypothetical protein [Agromyces sp. PvR057]|uniref:hypothetical protein n=1 Tax=Agromyces sp. PvR057 TaxID=3156403 RepID=UPI003397F7FB
MTIEVRSGANRATRRLLGVWGVGASAIAAMLIPLVARASSGSPSATSELVSVMVVGAFVCVGGVLLGSVIGFATSREARRAVARLRAGDLSAAVQYGRLASVHGIVALTVQPGKLGAWVDDGVELVALSEVTGIDAVALTSQKIWGWHYYALDVRSPDGEAVVTLGTRTTWGAAEASRSAHLRLAEKLLGASG